MAFSGCVKPIISLGHRALLCERAWLFPGIRKEAYERIGDLSFIKHSATLHMKRKITGIVNQGLVFFDHLVC